MIGVSAEARSAVSTLFDSAPAVLVEVRYPGCGTSADWYVCEDELQLERIVNGLARGAEIHLSNVQDLSNSKGTICFRL
jgi:hypothetical protein